MGILVPNLKLNIVRINFFDYENKMWQKFDAWVIANPTEPEWDQFGTLAYWSFKAETVSPITGMPTIVDLKIPYIGQETSEDMNKRIAAEVWGEKVNINRLDQYRELQKNKRIALEDKFIAQNTAF